MKTKACCARTAVHKLNYMRVKYVPLRFTRRKKVKSEKLLNVAILYLDLLEAFFIWHWPLLLLFACSFLILSCFFQIHLVDFHIIFAVKMSVLHFNLGWCVRAENVV